MLRTRLGLTTRILVWSSVLVWIRVFVMTIILVLTRMLVLTKAVVKTNPLKNVRTMLELNPYAAVQKKQAELGLAATMAKKAVAKAKATGQKPPANPNAKRAAAVAKGKKK